jgi:hypothetical protein
MKLKVSLSVLIRNLIYGLSALSLIFIGIGIIGSLIHHKDTLKERALQMPNYQFKSEKTDLPPVLKPLTPVASPNIPSVPKPSAAEHTLSLFIYGLGRNEDLLKKAFQSLPSTITLSLSPYTPNLEKWVDLGVHENRTLFLDLFLDKGDPSVDLGPLSLSLFKPWDEEKFKPFKDLLLKLKGMSGLTLKEPYVPEAFLKNLDEDLKTLNMFRFSIENPLLNFHQSSDKFHLKQMNTKIDVITKFHELYEKAKQQKFLLGIVEASPLVIDYIISWIPTLDPGQVNFEKFKGHF